MWFKKDYDEKEEKFSANEKCFSYKNSSLYIYKYRDI